MRSLILLCCLSAILMVTACANSDNNELGGAQIDSGIDDNFGDLQGANSLASASHSYAELVNIVDPKLVSANQKFALHLYQALASDADHDNLFISPLSISIALAMTYNGADGETKSEMAQVLQFNDMTIEGINQGYNLLKQLIESADPNVELAVANSLWARDGLTFKETFMNRNKNFFNAEINTLDFRQPQAVDMINEWVDEHTEGKIDSIIDGPISEDTILFLINAIYFKGEWTRPFEEKQTNDQPFHLNDGSTIDHPLMSQSGNYEYLENKHFQAIRLPYGKEENLSMLVFLPNEKSNLPEFHSKLTADNWKSWRAEFKKTEGSIQLPRFTMEYEETLNRALKSLGMNTVFDPKKANFQNMISSLNNVYIDNVKHKSFVEVNEIGTEAAAVTSVEARATSMPVDYFNMTVNRPFFFAIVEEATDTILFMGSIEKPEL